MGLIDIWKRRAWRRDDDAIRAFDGLAPAIVITGGSDGIGLALAQEFASPDFATVLIARTPEKLETARNILNASSHNNIFTLPLDITIATAADQISAFLGTHGLYADILINSAGIGTTGEFASEPAEKLTATTELNVTALTTLCRAFLPGMLVRGRGGIINVSSLGGFAPGPYQAAYYASKAYVISLTRALAHENRGQGVRFATLASGPVNTEFHARANGESALYRHILPAMSAQAIARSTKRGYSLGRSLIVPGIFGNLIALALRILPAMLTTPIVAILLKPRMKITRPKITNVTTNGPTKD